MMASLFLLLAIALILGYLQQRRWSIVFLVAGILLSLIMFFHHATDLLKINL